MKGCTKACVIPLVYQIFFFFSINLLDINFLAPYVGLYLPACLLPSFLLLDFDVIH